jgi:polyvinyl alcohol dehydrogenase (cytochrome)
MRALELELTSFVHPRVWIGTLVLFFGAVAACTDDSQPEGEPGPEPGPAWPSLGLDDANSRHNRDERTLSPDNVGQLVQRWRLDGFGKGVTSAPVVLDGVVYFGDWAGTLHAVRAADGTVVWQETIVRPESERDEAWAQINATPLVTTDRVFVGDGLGVLHARDRATGAPVWAVTLDDHEDANIYASPVLVDEVIVIGVAAVENNLDKDDYTFRGSLVGLSAADGRELWRRYTSQNDATSGAGVSIWSSAAIDRGRGLAYVGTGQAFEAPAGPYSDAVVAIDYRTGELRWAYQVTVDDVFTRPNLGPGPDADVGTSPNLFAIDGRDVVGAGDKGGQYTVLDRDTGELVWQVQLTAGSLIGGVMVTAAVGDGVIYVNSNRWRLYFFPLTGQHHPSDTSTTFALDARDGRVLWQTDLSAPAFGALALANGVVYQSTIDGVVWALDASDGRVLLSHELGENMGGGLTIVEGQLFAGFGFVFYSGSDRSTGGMAMFGLP